MKILAFDTSSEWLSVALLHDGDLHYLECDAQQQHAEHALPMIRQLLQSANLQLNQLDAIAYNHGPGAFTGLRIGCGIAQGLAYGTGLPLIGVCSLEAIAEQVAADQVYVCLDARMNQVFYAAYRQRSQHWEAVVPPALATPDRLPTFPGENWVGAGSGFVSHPAALRDRLGTAMTSVHPARHAHAREIARLAAIELSAGHTAQPEQASLLYLRDKVALTLLEQPRK